MGIIQKYFNRFEIKYHISLLQYRIMVPKLRAFMDYDLRGENRHSYEVHTLYFDSPDYACYYDKEDGLGIRRKVRIRHYPPWFDSTNPSVFLEIKRKLQENISKARLLVPYQYVLESMDPKNNIAQKLYNEAEPDDRKTIEEIWYSTRLYSLHPVIMILFSREALISKRERHFRITFDTNLRVRSYDFDLQKPGGISIYPNPAPIIMELKFTNMIPSWAIQILQAQNCVQIKNSKFTLGLEKTHLLSTT